LRNLAVTAVIVGVRRQEQVYGTIGAVELRSSEGNIEEIEAAIWSG
jgi:aryl-alcohol dehydrogenase-like predicted oxidoreductase